jgi:hypothetical protein
VILRKKKRLMEDWVDGKVVEEMLKKIVSPFCSLFFLFCSRTKGKKKKERKKERKKEMGSRISSVLTGPGGTSHDSLDIFDLTGDVGEVLDTILGDSDVVFDADAAKVEEGQDLLAVKVL